LSQPNSKLEAKLQALEDSAPELKELANTSLNNPVITTVTKICICVLKCHCLAPSFECINIIVLPMCA